MLSGGRVYRCVVDASGIIDVVASSGTALTGRQIRAIHRFLKYHGVVRRGYAGINARYEDDLLLEDGMNVKVVLLPGEDPDSFAKKQRRGNFHRYISENEVDFIRFKTELLLEQVGSDPIKRLAISGTW